MKETGLIKSQMIHFILKIKGWSGAPSLQGRQPQAGRGTYSSHSTGIQARPGASSEEKGMGHKPPACEAHVAHVVKSAATCLDVDTPGTGTNPGSLYLRCPTGREDGPAAWAAWKCRTLGNVEALDGVHGSAKYAALCQAPLGPSNSSTDKASDWAAHGRWWALRRTGNHTLGWELLGSEAMAQVCLKHQRMVGATDCVQCHQHVLPCGKITHLI